jgi:hypothetical protein
MNPGQGDKPRAKGKRNRLKVKGLRQKEASVLFIAISPKHLAFSQQLKGV